jgi:alpha-amylase/alpha-mannosidase (GH57 family)
MPQTKTLDVIFCWHMHQPQYRRSVDGSYRLPWAYLHAIKDYADMAWYLEQVPAARAVVNFTPVLVDQLDDYGRQFAEGHFRDPVLRALARPEGVSVADRPAVIASLFRANEERMIRRLPPLHRLQGIFEAARAGGYVEYLSAAFVSDLAVLYHLAWLGESVRRTDARAKQLIEKGERFDAADRTALLGLLADIVGGIVPRYRALAGQGRVELSTSPYAHPIVPLLIDFGSARESLPDALLPSSRGYPGGTERAVAHLRAAVDSHARTFGVRPAGCWPSEGAISRAAAALFAESGFTWTASCESVLVRSLQTREAGLSPRPEYLYRPYLVAGLERQIPCFFRDVHLSDLIGFRYADWHADDAVANFVSELEAIADATAGQESPVVSVILDGENAWEHYPENGFFFLSGLYRAVAASPKLRMTTFSDALARRPPDAVLDRLVAGSWVYGTLSTWIGDPDKNRAWELLVRAKEDFDAEAAAGRLTGDALSRAEMQLKVCEGSDWFWWFGDYNPAQTVSDFDQLFRDHLRDLYALIGVAAPATIDRVIGIGKGAPARGGAMRESAVP